MTRLYFLPILLLASPAYADNINQNQSGVGNTQNVGGVIGSPGANSPSAKAYGGNSDAKATAASLSTSSSNSKSSAYQGQHQVAKGGSADNKGNSLSVNQDYDQPVSSASAPALVAGSESCMGSSSAGGQGVGFGLSVGTTWHDEECERRKNATQLWNMSQKKAALALMCGNPGVADAMAAANAVCPTNPVAEAEPEQVVSRNSTSYGYPEKTR